MAGFGTIAASVGAFGYFGRIVMTRISLATALLTLCTTAAFAQTGTVNGYTPAELAKAKAAVLAAGYVPGALGASQGGNFFINAKKGGDSYMVTVTPDDHVYAGPPVSAAPAAPAPAAPAR
jgi:hypothetical protein